MRFIKSVLLAGVFFGAVGGVAVRSAAAGDFTPSWNGAYIGANVGYGRASGDAGLSESTDEPLLEGFLADYISAGGYPASLSPSASGVIGGGQAGYNWQLPSGWVVGLETDLQLSGIKGSDTQVKAPQFFDATSTTVGKKIEWYGTLRARAGYLVSPKWLIFATGGLAYGQTGLSVSTVDIDPVNGGCQVGANICADQSSSRVKLGWTAGGGVETMLSSNWSVKAEYLYVDLGQRSFDALSSTAPINFHVASTFHEQIVHVGLNYHFD